MCHVKYRGKAQSSPQQQQRAQSSIGWGVGKHQHESIISPSVVSKSKCPLRSWGGNLECWMCFSQLYPTNNDRPMCCAAARGAGSWLSRSQQKLREEGRKPSGHADKEVMAATVLTSLSTSPLVLNPSSAPTVPEPGSRAWKDVLSNSYSSSTSGNWSWDTSDQSVPSTPSPPLSNDANKNFPLLTPGDDVNEDVPESTHFMFEDPIPRKRKNSMKVMFKCLWKNCEKVLSTSSGIQRHVRTVHLGRNTDSDYSDGEEDFYYSEIEINMDSLTEGLSSLTPTSPTTCGPPPVFPLPLTAVPHSERINMNSSHCPTPTLLSQSAPSTLCHIRTDHAYQGPVIQVRTVSIGEKRQPAAITHSTVIKNHALITPAPKSAPGTRKPRGEAKKCRKVYGMEKRDMWCTACRWKKACQRFTD
ncbi:zinc finger protein 704 isoform X2 [Gymnodraco acuticeps]|uniref:Zinc finger protein 704 isoform X2 n=1 Tax=Gymnodraco acuticeps TaxID=8218 RepID=A0A6P8TXM7_GYMAC|nr:zinc finger protein 704 isoform X2 [Gymnodraco acuticeps]